MKRKSFSADCELLGPLTPRIVELFERGHQEKTYVKTQVDFYLAKSHPSVWDVLALAFFQNELSFFDPPLPDEDLPMGMRLWKYWTDHPREFSECNALGDKIYSHLVPPSRVQELKRRNEATMLELIGTDTLTFLALYPTVKELYAASPGRPVDRRFIAVKALQMKRDGRTWRQITGILCDCSKISHDNSCAEVIRHSVIPLKKLLHSLGVEVPPA